MNKPLKALWWVVLGALLACCQSPVASNSSSHALKLTFLISGTKTTASASGARLLLPSAQTLTVSLTPGSSSQATYSQSAAIASGATQASLEFSSVTAGSYTVSAQAIDGSGTVQFQQTSSVTISATQASTVTLNLVPTSALGLTTLGAGSSSSSALAANSSISFVVPSAAVSFGCAVNLIGSIASVEGFLQNSDGTSIGQISGGSVFGLQTTGGQSAFVTLYNPNASAVDYSVAVSSIAGSVTTIAGTGNSNSENGTGTSASFTYPTGIATDGTNLYIADTNTNLIRQMVIGTGVVTVLAGSGSQGSSNAPGIDASFYGPFGVATDGTNLYVADTSNNLIRQIVISTGVVTTVAGQAGTSGSADGPGSSATFNHPVAVATDGTNLYVADELSYLIRKIVIATGVVTTLAGQAGVTGSANGIGTSATFTDPTGLATDGTNLFVVDEGGCQVRKIVIATAEVTTMAGQAGINGSANGTGTNATFTGPIGVATDGAFVYVADTNGQLIRKIATYTC